LLCGNGIYSEQTGQQKHNQGGFHSMYVW
jgi:hypothetical protein